MTIHQTFRTDTKPDDIESVRRIVRSTGFFHDYEIDTAVELIEENLQKGEVASGYSFIFAEADGQTVGYSCFGPIACTSGSYDLYWIAVLNDFRNGGIGKALMKATEESVRKSGGRKIYVETSSKEQYLSTRSFYERFGYQKDAEIVDFYDVGDHKVIYSKAVNKL